MRLAVFGLVGRTVLGHGMAETGNMRSFQFRFRKPDGVGTAMSGAGQADAA